MAFETKKDTRTAIDEIRGVTIRRSRNFYDSSSSWLTYSDGSINFDFSFVLESIYADDPLSDEKGAKYLETVICRVFESTVKSGLQEARKEMSDEEYDELKEILAEGIYSVNTMDGRLLVRVKSYKVDFI
jgi:hypothetical protein